MERALRAAVRQVREPTHAERAELAGASPDTQAYLSVRMAEQAAGHRLSVGEIRTMEAQTRAFADAIGRLADERERLERQKATGDNGLGFTLEELAAGADPEGVKSDRCPPTEPGGMR